MSSFELVAMTERVCCAPGRFSRPVYLFPVAAPQGDGGSLKFPGYPCVCMPRSWTPVVSRPLAVTLPGLLPSDPYKPSAFPSFRSVILSDHKYTLFGALSRGLHTRYSWLHTHPFGYACRFTTDLVANLLWQESRLSALTCWVTSSNFTNSFSLPRIWI